MTSPQEAYRNTLVRRERRLRGMYTLYSGDFNAAGLRLLEICIKADAADWAESFAEDVAELREMPS